MFQEVLNETLIKTAQIAVVVLPLLFLVEYFNHHYGERLVSFFEKRKRFMPVWAALISMLPGCNAAVAIGLLYLRGFVSTGALVAAMIATSDEAIYVFIPQGFNFVPLFAAKLVLAIGAGYLIDYVTKRRKKVLAKGTDDLDFCCHAHHHVANTKEMFWHSLKHSLKIIGFVFGALLVFNYFKDAYGFEAYSQSIAGVGEFSPLFAGLIGLIPGCGTSVILATLYTEGVLDLGAALAGLSVASGDVLLVLIGSQMGSKRIIKIMTFIFLISVLAGYLVRYVAIF